MRHREILRASLQDILHKLDTVYEFSSQRRDAGEEWIHAVSDDMRQHVQELMTLYNLEVDG